MPVALVIWAGKNLPGFHWVTLTAKIKNIMFTKYVLKIVYINTARSALVITKTILIKDNTELNLGPN